MLKISVAKCTFLQRGKSGGCWQASQKRRSCNFARFMAKMECSILRSRLARKYTFWRDGKLPSFIFAASAHFDVLRRYANFFLASGHHSQFSANKTDASEGRWQKNRLKKAFLRFFLWHENCKRALQEKGQRRQLLAIPLKKLPFGGIHVSDCHRQGHLP